jgi:flagellin
MPIVINTNTAATVASFNLSRANDALRKSLGRLSSGKRIVSPADDAGGLAVAYKLASKLNRTEAVRTNVQNGVSFRFRMER